MLRHTRFTSLCTAWRCGVIVLFAVCLHVPAFGADTRNVLVIFSDNRLLPANMEADQALRDAIVGTPERPVELFVEYLDRSHFNGEAYEATIATYLRQKYATRPPEVVVTGGTYALAFVLRNRAVTFPTVPVVFLGLAVDEWQALQPQPRDILGVPMQFDYATSVAAALRLHPGTKHFVTVTGNSTAFDRESEREMRMATQQLATAGIEVEHLERLPTADVLQRLKSLGPNTVVYTPGYFSDGDGRYFSPRESAQLMAEAAAAPLYGPFSTFIGTGAVGGIMPSYSAMAQQGAEIVNELLDGVAPAAVTLASQTPAVMQVDWRQAQRWGIKEEQLPPGTIVHFKQPTFWEMYRNSALIALAVILLQTGLILALLYERRLQRRTAAALEASESRMLLAARTARLSDWVWNVGTERVNGNAVADLPHAPFSQEPAAVDLARVLETAHPADRERLSRAVAQAVADDDELNIEYRVAQGNRISWFAARGRLEQGNRQRLRGVATDITQRKVAELQAEQDRAALGHMTRVSLLGQLSASIAHQLNQPLAAILSNAEAAQKMLQRDDVDLAELREICNDIVTEDNRAAQVIRRLGALYRRGERELRPVDINELILETLELLHSDLVTRHVTVVTDFAATLAPVEGERVQLQQVFMNLIVNAADALATVPESDRTLTIRTLAGADAVQIDVVDAGLGIAGDALDRIFDMFWTSKSGGMGIGLAICRTIVSAHGGTLTAANNADKGATFRVTLPVGAS